MNHRDSESTEIPRCAKTYLAALRLCTTAADTVATVLSMLPQGLVMRTQNGVSAVIAGVSTDGALPPIGWVKSRNPPWYHWYERDDPVAMTETIAVDPEATL